MSAMRFFVATLRHCVLTTFSVLLDLGRLFLLALHPRAALAAENLSLRKAVSALPGAEGQALPRCRLYSMVDGDREPAVRLAEGAGGRQT